MPEYLWPPWRSVGSSGIDQEMFCAFRSPSKLVVLNTQLCMPTAGKFVGQPRLPEYQISVLIVTTDESRFWMQNVLGWIPEMFGFQIQYTTFLNPATIPLLFIYLVLPQPHQRVLFICAGATWHFIPQRAVSFAPMCPKQVPLNVVSPAAIYFSCGRKALRSTPNATGNVCLIIPVMTWPGTHFLVMPPCVPLVRALIKFLKEEVLFNASTPLKAT